jgi:hypothetical protein
LIQKRADGLISVDINTAQEGSTINTGTSYQVTCYGADIWGSNDSFYFLYEQKTGDFEVVVRIANMTADSDQIWAKAGIMIRESLDPDSANYFVHATPAEGERGCQFQGRESSGSPTITISQNPKKINYPNMWLRLKRLNNVMSGYRSEDGQVWVKIGSKTAVSCTGQVYVGLASSPSIFGKTMTASFESYQIRAATPEPDPDLSGGLNRYLFSDITGNLINDLTNDPRYPDNASTKDNVAEFESVLGSDNYGERLWGWLIPPQTGVYVFYLASDDAGQLFLSSDASPANNRMIAEIARWTSVREYNYSDPNNPEPKQKSDPIQLVQGQHYYIEALHKEGNGGEHISVAWQMPGGPAPQNGDDPIQGAYLSPTWQDTLTVDRIPVILIQGTVGKTYVLQSATSLAPQTWTPLTTVILNASPQSWIDQTVSGSQRFYRGYQVLSPSTVDAIKGLKRQLYFMISGGAVADLTSSDLFPAYPDVEDIIFSYESSWGLGDYGQKLSGYLLPPTTGNYQFYLASDDASQVWLSTDANPANKRLIVEETVFNANRNYEGQYGPNPPTHWLTGEPLPQRVSAPIYLEAGKFYYTEALHKQKDGPECFAVAWKLPGGSPPLNGSEPISGAYLSPVLPITPSTFSLGARPVNRLTVSGTVGKSYRIDYATPQNPNGWTPLTTLILNGGASMQWIDEQSLNQTRYYQLVPLP